MYRVVVQRPDVDHVLHTILFIMIDVIPFKLDTVHGRLIDNH